MGACPHALFRFLVQDLLPGLPGFSSEDILSSKRGSLRRPEGASGGEAARISLLNSILKKYQEKSEVSDGAALQKFLEANALCERFSWPIPSSLNELQAIALGESKKELYNFFFTAQGEYWLTHDTVRAGARFGPGASVKASGDSFYHKVGMSPLSSTSGVLVDYYQSTLSKFGLWRETEKIRSARYGDFMIVRGSRLSYVPKNAEISRTICTEPLLNMFFQQGIGSQFERWLNAKFGINFVDQPFKNRELARIGSETGLFGTIDLSSASDTISLTMLRSTLPAYILGWLCSTRSQITTLPDGREVALHMVSSMGNGFTFPLQTIIFSCIVLGVYKALGITPSFTRKKNHGYKQAAGNVRYNLSDGLPSRGNFSVFGDDIIVCREAYDLTIFMLRTFGFLPNTDKSYSEGLFRESCGSDFWAGLDVRGVYCERLKSTHDIYSLFNRLNVWSCNHGIPIPLTLEYLLGQVKFLPVPPWDSDVSGVKVPLWAAGPLSKDRHTGCIVYRRFVPRQKELSLLNVEALKRVPRGFYHNPPAILLSAVGGYVRNGSVVERQRLVQYTKRLSFSPSWDWWDPRFSRLTRSGWRNFLFGSVFLALGKN